MLFDGGSMRNMCLRRGEGLIVRPERPNPHPLPNTPLNPSPPPASQILFNRSLPCDEVGKLRGCVLRGCWTVLQRGGRGGRGGGRSQRPRADQSRPLPSGLYCSWPSLKPVFMECCGAGQWLRGWL